MKLFNLTAIDSPLGKLKVDTTGSPIGVAHMDTGKSYAGIGELLQNYINHSNAEAWQTIKNKIDYTYENIDSALSSLERETSFGKAINLRLEKGQKLLFKPNLVMPNNIDPQTHGPDSGSTTCTEWPFVAALMRWFHDKLGISYHMMTVGEAATAMTATASLYSLLNTDGRTITPEAVMEGKCGDFYGGWGFFFVRKYLAESLAPGCSDDPLKGYEESVTGTYIPPCQISDKLMVYDLNRIFDDTNKGREIQVPDGVNYKSITLHKVIVGGDPSDPEDLKAYPGCILVNVPKLKVHSIALFTNAIKNLGIGLYPMQVAKAGLYKWDYSLPHKPVPAMKGGIHHQVWVSAKESESGLPGRDSKGNYVVKKTGGITATMIDIIKAVNNQDIFSIHIVDAIEAINLDHTGRLPGPRVPEGLVFAGLDPVATDLLCSRYLFCNVPLEEAVQVDLYDGAGGQFPQRVPIPELVGKNIATRQGYDCPLSRDICFENAEKRGLGKRSYHVTGWDSVKNLPLVSLQGHLGTVKDGKFSDLNTEVLYFDAFKVIWDLQQTSFKYFEAVDKLTGSSLKRDFLEAFSENGNGSVTYEEFGKKGIFGLMLHQGGEAFSTLGTEKLGFLKGPFISQVTQLKCCESAWNPDGHNLMKEYYYVYACLLAYRMSLTDLETPDPFLPGLYWGKGKWPSFQLAWYAYLGNALYGSQFPERVAFPSLYGSAFRYADLTQNEGRYTGHIRSKPDADAFNGYVLRVSEGKEKPLNFTFYVPEGYDKAGRIPLPNVEVTKDSAKILTATFAGGKEIWSPSTNLIP